MSKNDGWISHFRIVGSQSFAAIKLSQDKKNIHHLLQEESIALCHFCRIRIEIEMAIITNQTHQSCINFSIFKRKIKLLNYNLNSKSDPSNLFGDVLKFSGVVTRASELGQAESTFSFQLNCFNLVKPRQEQV